MSIVRPRSILTLLRHRSFRREQTRRACRAVVEAAGADSEAGPGSDGRSGAGERTAAVVEIGKLVIVVVCILRSELTLINIKVVATVLSVLSVLCLCRGGEVWAVDICRCRCRCRPTQYPLPFFFSFLSFSLFLFIFNSLKMLSFIPFTILFFHCSCSLLCFSSFSFCNDLSTFS